MGPPHADPAGEAAPGARHAHDEGSHAASLGQEADGPNDPVGEPPSPEDVPDPRMRKPFKRLALVGEDDRRGIMALVGGAELVSPVAEELLPEGPGGVRRARLKGEMILRRPDVPFSRAALDGGLVPRQARLSGGGEDAKGSGPSNAAESRRQLKGSLSLR